MDKVKKVKKPSGSPSIYLNPAFIGPVIDLSNNPRKVVIKKSYYLFQAGKEWLSKHYSEVQEELNFMDLFGFNLDSESCEIEVKMADYDLYKEKAKECKVFKHKSYAQNDMFCPTYFYFLVPTNLVKKCVKFCETYFPNYGVMEFVDNTITIHKAAERLTERTFQGELLQFKQRDRKHTFYSKI